MRSDVHAQPGRLLSRESMRSPGGLGMASDAYREVMSELQREESSGSENERGSVYDSDDNQENHTFSIRSPRMRRSKGSGDIDADDVSPLVNKHQRRASLGGHSEAKRMDHPIKSILRNIPACEGRTLDDDTAKGRQKPRVTFSETPDVLPLPRRGRRASVAEASPSRRPESPQGDDVKSTPVRMNQRRRNSLPHIGLNMHLSNSSAPQEGETCLPIINGYMEDEEEESDYDDEEDMREYLTSPSASVDGVVCEVVHSFTPRPTVRSRRSSYAGLTAAENSGQDGKTTKLPATPRNAPATPRNAPATPRNAQGKTAGATCAKKTDHTSKPSKAPQPKAISGKPANKTDSGKPANKTDSGKPANKTDSGKPANKTDSGKQGTKTDNSKGKPGSARRRHSVF